VEVAANDRPLIVTSRLALDIDSPLTLVTVFGVPTSAGGAGAGEGLSAMIIVPGLGVLQLQAR